MGILTTTLLAVGVILLSYGINQNNSIMIIVGGILLGTYNGIISSYIDL